jgi:hypothetical protein
MVSKIMKINDLKASFNMPKKLKTETDEHEEETSHGLPPYDVQSVYNVDRYKACPVSWMNGSDIASSYFAKVEPGRGMWLDFNQNFSHTHDVAVVLSIQGINPITGLKTDKLRLEQFKKKCPVHGIDFKSSRLCDKCGFEWPAQNYLTTTVTPSGQLWLDGFRAPDGKVRQYVFTEEEMKGVAFQLIGNDRVFAIGIAFYVSKEKKPVRENNNFWNTPYKSLPSYGYMRDPDAWTPVQYKSSAMYSLDDKEYLVTCSAGGSAGGVDAVEPVKNLEIGAGAMIDQKVYPDTKGISHWEEKPSGMIYLNYCDEITFKKIIKAGQKETVVDGFMAGVEKV